VEAFSTQLNFFFTFQQTTQDREPSKMKNARAVKLATLRQQLAAGKSQKVSNSLSKPIQPVGVSVHSSFIYFSRLPPEIRLEVWRFALAKAFEWRVICGLHIECGSDRRCFSFGSHEVVQKDEKKLSRLKITPNKYRQLDDASMISLVCHESRHEAVYMASLCRSPDINIIMHCPLLVRPWTLTWNTVNLLSAAGKRNIFPIQHMVLTRNFDALCYGWKMLIATLPFPMLPRLQTLSLALERQGILTEWTLGCPESQKPPPEMVMLSDTCTQYYAKIHDGKLLHVNIWLPSWELWH